MDSCVHAFSSQIRMAIKCARKPQRKTCATSWRHPFAISTRRKGNARSNKCEILRKSTSTYRLPFIARSPTYAKMDIEIISPCMQIQTENSRPNHDEYFKKNDITSSSVAAFFNSGLAVSLPTACFCFFAAGSSAGLAHACLVAPLTCCCTIF